LPVCAPLIIEEIAAARAAVKFGSAVMAAVAALTVSVNEGGGGGSCGCGWPMNWVASVFDEVWRPENLDWLKSAWPKICGNI